MPIGDVGPEIALALAAVAALLAAAFLPQSRQPLCAGIALLGVLAALLLGAQQLTTPPRLGFSGSWALDGIAVQARLLIVLASGLCVLLAPRWLADDRRNGEFYSLLLLSAVGAMMLAGAADLLQLSLAVLLSSVTGYTLAAYHRDWSISVEAGMKYFLIGAFANALLMVGVTLLFGLLGTTRYDAMATALAGAEASPLLLIGAGLCVLGIAFKLAAFPLHAWLPDVAEGAPAPAAAFLTVVPKVGAAVALARLVGLFPVETLDLRPLVAVLALLTMSLGNLAALWQDDLRRLLGWSSVSQSGYALVAVALVGLSPRAEAALLYFLLGYALANLAAFAVVAELRGRTRLADYAGLGAIRPWAALVLVLSLLSLTGIPPLVGFVGKLLLFSVAIDGGYAWLAVAAVINTVISLFYYLRPIGTVYFGRSPSAVAVLGGSIRLSLVLVGSALLLAGLAADWLLQLAAAAHLLALID